MIGNIVAGTFSTGVAPVFGAYESIATTTLSSAQTTITFSSIPSTYKHLQIRSSYTLDNTANNLYMTLNGSTGSSRWHYLFGDGSSAVAGSSTDNLISIQFGNAATTLYANVIDFLDYTSTTKTKVLRSLCGVDFNGSGGVYLSSNLYNTTSAISSITIGVQSGFSLGQYTKFALYGIKD
jgi:hypothetical protein